MSPNPGRQPGLLGRGAALQPGSLHGVVRHHPDPALHAGDTRRPPAPVLQAVSPNGPQGRQLRLF